MNPTFSLVIITKDRADDLRTILLPSLLKQVNLDGNPYNDFEVILWDGSTTDKTKKVIDEFISQFADRAIPLRYFVAPRLGTSKQRNDGIKKAKGSLIAFFDDDCQISPDGLIALKEALDENPTCLGASLRLKNNKGELEKPSLSQKLLRPLPHGKLTHRRMKPLGGLAAPHEIAGLAYTLPGAAMVLRREAFDLLNFDEELQHFSAYAFGEDRLLSAGLYKLTKRPYIIASRGWAWHQENPEVRALDQQYEGKLASQFYNRWYIWRHLTNWPTLLYPLFSLSFFFRYRKLSKLWGREAARRGLALAKKRRQELLDSAVPFTLRNKS